MTTDTDSSRAEAVEQYIRIAIWNTAKWQGKPDEVAMSFIRHAMDEPCMKRALAALSTPTAPTDASGLAEEPAPYTCKHSCERDGLMDTITAQAQELARLRAALERRQDAIEELVECARLRGDNDLPHPCDDPKLWTARMIDAWGEVEDIADNAALQPKEQSNVG